MSDDILSVVTAFSDVAALAQGFMNRADGERLLLPLADGCSAGSGVRFVVYLADGTPAFAGAGLCAQVSDQGPTVPPAQRYETLLDTLQFDERSRPVYDYIVAVRSAAYAQPSSSGEEISVDEIVRSMPPPDYDEDATMMVAPPQRDVVFAEESSSDEPVFEESGAGEAELDGAPVANDEPAAGSLMISGRPSSPAEALPAGVPSFVPPPIPTGLLSRPARASQWQPAPPRRPTPRISTGLFRYGASGLPRPARPPRPDLDPSQQVQPAARPA